MTTSGFPTAKALALSLFFLACNWSLCACSEENLDQDKGVTAQGSVDLGTIKLGTADQVFQEATVTFVRDLSASANSGGKRQYLSRGESGQGGQYMVQLKDGSCFQISVIYKDRPVSREVAEAAMKNLLPEGAPPQSRVDDGSLSQAKPANGQNFQSIYYFGDDYLGVLDFTDKNGNQVKQLTLSNISLLKRAQSDSQAQKESLQPLVEKAKQQLESGEH